MFARARAVRLFVLLSVFFTALLTACANSPTGRSQLILVGDAQMNKMGADSFSALSEEKQAITLGPEFNYVRCIADAILTADGRNPLEWEIKVFSDDSANAFALPGNKIGVHTGMIKLAQTPSQLAAVMGH